MLYELARSDSLNKRDIEGSFQIDVLSQKVKNFGSNFGVQINFYLAFGSLCGLGLVRLTPLTVLYNVVYSDRPIERKKGSSFQIGAPKKTKT